MIDRRTKQKFLKELEKSGNVYIAALKVGIHRDTHYRWRKKDKKYRALAELAEKQGRENNSDIAEHALMLNVKDRKMDAIKYLLSHNSSKYKPKRAHVIIDHRTKSKDMPISQKDFSELLYEEAAIRKRLREQWEDEQKEKNKTQDETPPPPTSPSQ